MSLVNAETGELIATMTPDEAREVTDRIRTALGVTWELVVDAYKRRAWAAMGYPSWDAYTEAEFGGTRLRLPREEREQVVASLRESGMSIRAIASATGHSVNTVAKDLQVSHSETPADPSEVEQGSASPAPSDEEPGVAPPPPAPDNYKEREVDVLEKLRQAAIDEAAKKITGTDGKSYPDKSRAAVAARVGKAKAMAKEGYTSRQSAHIARRRRESIEDLLLAVDREGSHAAAAQRSAHLTHLAKNYPAMASTLSDHLASIDAA